jgi:hypothetical protein
MIIALLITILFVILILILLLLFTLNIGNLKIEEPFTNDNDTNSNSLNIVLIGDSILNNSAYVSADQSVPDILSKKMNENIIYNFAKDGSTINDCYAQLEKISLQLDNSKTSIFLSCGGNNILNSRDNKAIANLFAKYKDLIASIKTRVPNASLYVLNLYYPTDGHYVSYRKAIEQWNGLLQSNSSSSDQKYNLIDLSSLLVLEEDFVYGIEPSFKGGQKIVDAISNSVVN